MPKAATAAAAALALVFAVAAAEAQEVPAAAAEKLAAEKTVLSFQARPETLALLPRFSGSDAMRERHAALQPHFSQEGLFLLPGDCPPVDNATALAILAAVPTLSGLSFPDERTGRPVKLFSEAQLLGDPVIRGDTLSFVLRTSDVDFGTARFDVLLTRYADRAELRMVNLDSLHYLIFPSVSPGGALVDLVYFPRAKDPLIYVAWSVRAALPVPGFVDIERPLRYRALAIKNWYVKQLEGEKK